MSMYEALERAREDAAGGAPLPVKSILTAPNPAVDRIMQSVCQQVEAMIQPSNKVVAFAGAQPGDESSRLIAEFARVVTTTLYRNTLFVVGGRHSVALKKFSPKPAPSWEKVLEGAATLEETLVPVAENLCLARFAESDANLPRLVHSDKMTDLVEQCRSRFELILIDAPPFGFSGEAALLSRLSDGIILIVEARRTRWQVVRNAIDQVDVQNGHVMGVILNKRRFYIPPWLYKRL